MPPRMRPVPCLWQIVFELMYLVLVLTLRVDLWALVK
jgi:hypothetical protein